MAMSLAPLSIAPSVLNRSMSENGAILQAPEPPKPVMPRRALSDKLLILQDLSARGALQLRSAGNSPTMRSPTTRRAAESKQRSPSPPPARVMVTPPTPKLKRGETQRSLESPRAGLLVPSLSGSPPRVEARPPSAPAVTVSPPRSPTKQEHKASELAGLDISELFGIFDTDGDGVVGLSEFIAVMAAVGESFSIAEVEFIFRDVDRDGDGALNQAEFANMLVTYLT